MKKISPTELKSFTFAVFVYLIISSLMVYWKVPGYVVGTILAVWTLAVFSFDFSKWKQTIDDIARLTLGLTLPYLIFLGTGPFLQIFKYYIVITFLATAFWVIYKTDEVKKEMRKNFLDY